MELEQYNLTPQQQLLVSLYMKSMNKSKSARDAGYYSSTRMFENPNVMAAINEQMKIRARRLRIGADWVLMEAVKVYNRCMQIEMIEVKDRDGLPSGEFKFDAANAVKALTLIGRHTDILAFEPEQAHVNLNQEIMSRLRRGRERLEIHPPVIEPEVSFFKPLPTVEPVEDDVEPLVENAPEELPPVVTPVNEYANENVTTDFDIELTPEQKLQELLNHVNTPSRLR